jgi:hypothetical protein
MLHEGQLEVGYAHAATVVGDANQATTAVLKLNNDARSTGINAVLDQLLDDRERSLDHFSSGDLANDLGR